MFYDFSITVTAGTTKATPKRQTLYLSKGIIYHVDVRFEAGCQREVKCLLRRQAHVLFPNEETLFFCSEDEVIRVRVHEELLSEPYELYFEGWSPNADYDHVITVRVGILPEWILLPTLRLANALDKFLRLIPGYK